MTSSKFRTLLVIGDEHQKIASKYSLDTQVPPYVMYRFDDMEEIRKKAFKYYENLFNEAVDGIEKGFYVKDHDDGLVYLREKLRHIQETTDFEFYQEISKGCWYGDNGNAWSTVNPEAHYQYEKCYDRRIKIDQNDEAPFSNPFILLDGTKAYSAKKCEIDWNMMHMANIELYRSAWQVCVEGREPADETEAQIKNSFENRKEYFSNFNNEEEYVNHNCAFWTYGVAYEDEYFSGEGVKGWTTGFYKRFIEPLSQEALLTIYEIKLLDFEEEEKLKLDTVIKQ